MKIKEKICYNFHTHEVIGFEEGALEVDVLMKEFNAIHKRNETEKVDALPDVAKHILLFMMRRWDKFRDPLKRSIARYSVGSSNGENLERKIRRSCPLYVHYPLVVSS